MQGPSSWFDTRIYLAVAASLLVVIVFYNRYVAVLGAILLYVLYLYGRERYVSRQKALSDYLSAMAHNIDEASDYALRNLPLGIAMVDTDGMLHWHNAVMEQWLGNALQPGKHLTDVWPDFVIADLTDDHGRLQLQTDSSIYEVVYKRLSQKAGSHQLIILYIADITETETLRQFCHDSLPVLAYVQIDNYGDVLTGLTDSQRSTILAAVHQILGKWVHDHDGACKKYSDDLYMVVLSRAALDQVLDEKFHILDKVRTVNGGNRIPVTISIGVAAEEDSISGMSERAQSGLDLALGRGGDQAAVYIAGEVHFYGGMTKAVEKNTRVKARVVSQALHELIDGADNVLITGHINEDFDSLGASLGIAKMAQLMGKPANIILSEPPTIAVDKLQEMLAEHKEYYSVFRTVAQAKELINRETLLFIVDTHRPELIAGAELLDMVERKVIIDHHRRARDFVFSPLLVYLEPSASSTSELLVELLTYFSDDIRLNRLEASLLYAGIVVDTKNFIVQTGVRTFDAASFLRRSGADPSVVQQLFSVDYDTVRSRAEIINNTEMLPGGMVLAFCPDNIKNASIVAAQTADMLLAIHGVAASFVLAAAGDMIMVSARSQGDINVQLIMEALGGGGHQTVAGAQLKQTAMPEAKAQVKKAISDYIEESVNNEGHITARS